MWDNNLVIRGSTDVDTDGIDFWFTETSPWTFNVDAIADWCSYIDVNDQNTLTGDISPNAEDYCTI